MTMIDAVVISALPGDRRAAALLQGRLCRLVTSGGEDESRVGDIVLGKVTRVAPAIGAVFVDLGSGRHGLLMNSDVPEGQRLAEGEAVLVQLTREAEGDKGPKLTVRLPAAAAVMMRAAVGARPPCRLAHGPDPILALVRDAVCAGACRVVIDDAAFAAAVGAAVPEVAGRIELWHQPRPLFAATGVDDALDHALSRVVSLPSGGRLIIDEAAALTAVDVDVGATAGPSGKTTAITCNLEAAAALGREIRARDLAGLIAIDFVPLRRATERARVLTALREALAGDDRRIRIGGWTRLGLVELARERCGPSLARRVTAACVSCGTAARTRAPAWAAGDALRTVLAVARRGIAEMPSLAVSPAVLQVLQGPLAAATVEVERKLGGPLRVIACDGLPADGFRLEFASVNGRAVK
jgi:Ribonuclease G/E